MNLPNVPTKLLEKIAKKRDVVKSPYSVEELIAACSDEALVDDDVKALIDLLNAKNAQQEFAFYEHENVVYFCHFDKSGTLLKDDPVFYRIDDVLHVKTENGDFVEYLEPHIRRKDKELLRKLDEEPKTKYLWCAQRGNVKGKLNFSYQGLLISFNREQEYGVFNHVFSSCNGHNRHYMFETGHDQPPNSEFSLQEKISYSMQALWFSRVGDKARIKNMGRSVGALDEAMGIPVSETQAAFYHADLCYDKMYTDVGLRYMIKPGNPHIDNEHLGNKYRHCGVDLFRVLHSLGLFPHVNPSIAGHQQEISLAREDTNNKKIDSTERINNRLNIFRPDTLKRIQDWCLGNHQAIIGKFNTQWGEVKLCETKTRVGMSTLMLDTSNLKEMDDIPLILQDLKNRYGLNFEGNISEGQLYKIENLDYYQAARMHDKIAESSPYRNYELARN